MIVSHNIRCIICHKTFNVSVDENDYNDWVEGKLIQHAMPYLSTSDRELLISRTCGNCFDKMFKTD